MTVHGIKDDKLRELVRAAKAVGWTTSLGGGGHLRFFTPDGRYITSCTTTPTSERTYYNTRARLRRAGLDC